MPIELGAGELPPGGMTQVSRTLVVTRGDMAPISELALNVSDNIYGYIEGRVRENETQKALPGMNIEVRMYTPNDRGLPLYPPFALTQTDASGFYKIALPRGNYFVQARGPGRPRGG